MSCEESKLIFYISRYGPYVLMIYNGWTEKCVRVCNTVTTWYLSQILTSQPLLNGLNDLENDCIQDLNLALQFEIALFRLTFVEMRQKISGFCLKCLELGLFRMY